MLFNYKLNLRLSTIFFLSASLLSSSGLHVALAEPQQLTKPPSFNWSSVLASPDLIWHDCYPSGSIYDSIDSRQEIISTPTRLAQCARLSLPLDYRNASNPHNVALALLKISTSPSRSPHRGTIIAAPGGAGSSRITVLLAMNQDGFLELLDPDHEYDFLTFEQRGIGYSQPSARCFGSVLGGNLWEERLNDASGVIGTDEGHGSLGVRLAGAKARGELCGRVGDEEDNIVRHMSTAYAARDMLEILKKMGDPKLQFLGFSYGTVLGLTFASLYPQHVSRMLLDGTANGNDWVAKYQTAHLTDTDAVWSTFYTDCFVARSLCPLWRDQDSGSRDVETRVDAFLDELKETPAYSVNDGSARLITYRDVRMAMVMGTYVPMFAFPELARVMDELIRGYTNVTLDFPFEGGLTNPVCVQDEDDDVRADSNYGAGTALNCGDAEDISDDSLDDFKHYLSALERQSSIGAFAQGERKLRCLGWPRSLRPKFRFTGPFGSAALRSKHEDSTPPLLFLSNRLDPLTPISNAHEMVRGFPGSVVLEQNGRGHCALASGVPSLCTVGYVRGYLRDGVLPQVGTVCEADCNVFNGSCAGSDSQSRLWLG